MLLSTLFAFNYIDKCWNSLHNKPMGNHLLCALKKLKDNRVFSHLKRLTAGDGSCGALARHIGLNMLSITL